MNLTSVTELLRRGRAAVLDPAARRAAWRRWRRPAAWVLGTYLGVQALLALLVPWVVKGPVLTAAAEFLGRPVTVASARFDPFSLTLTVRDLRIQDPAAQDLARIQRIEVNLSVASLLRAAPVLDAVHLEAPHLTLVRTDNGRLNIADLIDKLAASPREPDAAPARFAVRDLKVQGGELQFEDRLQHTRHTLQKIEFSLPYVASFESDRDTAVTPLLSASVHGGTLRVGAEAKPFKANHEATLHVSLQGLNLASALEGLPALAPWQVAQGSLDSQWQLTLRAAAAGEPDAGGLKMLAQGRLQLRSLDMGNAQGDRLACDDASVESRQLTLALSPQHGLHWKVDAGQLALHKLQLRDARDAPALFSVDTFQLDGLGADSLQRTLTLQQLAWDGLQLQAHRAPNGTLNLLSLLDRLPRGGPAAVAARAPVATSAPLPASAPVPAPEPEPAATSASAVSPSASASDQPSPPPGPAARPAPAVKPDTPWALELAQVRIAHTSLQWHDEAAKPVVQWGVKELHGELSALSTRPDAEIHYALETELVNGGTIELQGTAHPGPRRLASEVKVSGLNLAVMQPYLAQVLSLQLSKGRLDTQGRLHAEVPAQAPLEALRVGFQGQASIDELYTREPDTEDEFLRWKRLGASGLDIDVAPLALSAKDHIHIGGLTLQDLYAKIVISKAGRINLQDILRLPTGPKTARAAAAAPPPAASAAKSDAPQVQLGGVKVAGGRINFTDLFIKPNYSTTVTDLSGTVSAVTPQGPPAQLSLQGRIEGDAPVTIQGRINPVSNPVFADITAKARGIDLPMLSPYSTKYTGYPIQRGKLSLDVAYKIENNQLQAQNSIFLDQLTFGERVDSPTATQLPVLFAVSVLKNSRGEINLHLPISGSLNDPQFSVGALVSQVFVNLVKRAVTAPFSLLASMFSGNGASDLSTADFVPGTAELTPESMPRLAKLSQALTERPALKLDITAQVDPVAELGAIRRARLMARMQAERRKASPATEAAAADEPPTKWDEHDYAHWLQRVYDNTQVPNKPRNLIGISKKIPVADMESLVMSATVVSEDDLRNLAQARVHAVRKILAEQVPPERLFTLAPVIAAAKTAPDKPAAEGQCSAACVAFALH